MGNDAGPAYGTVFEIPAGTKTLTNLVQFNGLDGANPKSDLMFDASGNLYGTTEAGGSNGIGTIFEITASTHTFRSLLSFNGTDGSDPQAGLVLDADGNLYGPPTPAGRMTMAPPSNSRRTLAT